MPLINGTSGNDTLPWQGDRRQDLRFCRNDSIEGGAGTDQLYGMEGDDVLHGQDGADFIFGGSGGDFISGGAGLIS